MDYIDKITNKFWDMIIKKSHFLFFVSIMALGMIIRLKGFDYLSGDYYFFSSWFENLQTDKMYALGHAECYASIFFQTVFLFLTYIPGKSVYI